MRGYQLIDPKNVVAPAVRWTAGAFQFSYSSFNMRSSDSRALMIDWYGNIL